MLKIVVRSIFYQWLFLFTGIAIGFICNSEYVGEKAIIIERSIKNIFFPIEFNPQIEAWVKELGQQKIWTELGNPRDFKVLEEVVRSEEYYWAIIKYTDVNTGKEIKTIASTKIRWRPWEYNYHTKNYKKIFEERLKSQVDKR